MNPSRRQLHSCVRHIGTLVLGLLLGACLRSPQEVLPPALLPDPTMLLGRLAALDGRFDSLAALARAHIVRDGASRTLQQALLVRKPDRLRVDVLGPFSSPLLQVAAASRLQVHIPGEGRFYAGEPSTANLARFTGLPLPVEQLVGLLLLELPRFHYSAAATSWRAGAVVLTLDDGGRMRQEFAFAVGGELLRAAYWREGELLCEVRYGDYAGEEAFPRQISLRLPAAGIEANLELTEIDTTRTLDEARFLLKVPAQTPILPFPES